MRRELFADWAYGVLGSLARLVWQARPREGALGIRAPPVDQQPLACGFHRAGTARLRSGATPRAGALSIGRSAPAACGRLHGAQLPVRLPTLSRSAPLGAAPSCRRLRYAPPLARPRASPVPRPPLDRLTHPS